MCGICWRAANFPGFLPPDRIMAVMRADKRMRNFMQNRITNMICLRAGHTGATMKWFYL